MKSTWIAALMGSFVMATAAVQAMSSPQQAAVHAVEGQMLITADGARIGRVYQVKSDGSVQIIVDYSMVTIPASTLSVKHGELTTSLTRQQVRNLQ